MSGVTSGTPAIHGVEASTTKKSAPVSRTVRSTSESTSPPAASPPADSGASCPDAGSRAGRLADAAASDPDSRSWTLLTARSYTPAKRQLPKGRSAGEGPE